MEWKEQRTGPRRKFLVSSPPPPPPKGPGKAQALAAGTYPVQVAVVLVIVSASVAAVPTMTATAIRIPNTSANGDVGVVRESERDENATRTSGIVSANGLRGEAGMICQSGIRTRGHGVGGIGKV